MILAGALLVSGGCNLWAQQHRNPDVDFAGQIQPILERSCVQCHGRGKSKGGFRLDTRETVLKGGETGPALIPGHSKESYLIELVTAEDELDRMPQKGSPLTPSQIQLLRDWIDQGAPWPNEITFARPPAKNLHPAKPALPEGGSVFAESRHPIDRLLTPYYQQHRVEARSVVSDRVFARRVYLDLLGVLPTPEELQQFLQDSDSEKRIQLVRRLLSRNKDYAQHWLSFWNDLLRNDYAGTGFIDGGRKQITEWLYDALMKNKPYDQFVSELVNPVPGSEGFTKGIVWRGVVNASQRPEMQAAQNISQVFMGVNLKCASCHDSFIDDWRLADAYGMASIYAEEPLELVQCDKPTGTTAVAKFLYPELGEIPREATREERMERLADILTSPGNGRLTQTIVNRLWHRLFGRGLVEPLDTMDQNAWHPDLLHWLAEDFRSHDCNLKHLLERIVTSHAYQQPAVPTTDPSRKQDEYVFRGPQLKRLSAEQFVDALHALTGTGYSAPKGEFNLLAGTPYEEEPSALWKQVGVQPAWIWNQPDADGEAPSGTVYFARDFELDWLSPRAMAVVTCDNEFTLYVNGEPVADSRSYDAPALANLQPHLKLGVNTLVIEARNAGSSPNPAGLFFYLHMGDPHSGREFELASDSQFQVTAEKPGDWSQPFQTAVGWQATFELGPVEAAPWSLGETLARSWVAARDYGHYRASMVTSDPLLAALGRPNREQVMTARSGGATTLQALALTNGDTLARHIRQGAEELLRQANPEEPVLLVRRLYQHGLSREPTQKELSLAVQVVGKPLQREGVEDFVWSMSMLPEFQIIR